MEAICLHGYAATAQPFSQKQTLLLNGSAAKCAPSLGTIFRPAALPGSRGSGAFANREKIGSDSQLSTRRQRRLVSIPRATGRDVAAGVKTLVADGESYADDVINDGIDSVADAATKVEEAVAPEFASWNGITEKLTLGSSFAGLFLMAPQILKNAELLSSGQAAAVGILPWLGYSTGFLGNMLLLSYFATKRELSATLVQAVGATSTCILLSQIYLAGYMPPPAFAAVASFLVVGLVVNALQFARSVPPALWAIWEDLTGVIGLAVLPQVVWQTFFPSSQTIVPGATAAAAATGFVIMLRMGRLPEELRSRWAKLSGWTATLLFMFMPVAQLKECFARPESLAGISPMGPVMGVVSNGLMIPRALFTRDFMWFTGASWGALMMGWGVLLSMVLNNAIGQPLFCSVTGGLLVYLTTVVIKDSQAHRLPSPLASLRSLLRGGR